MHIYNGYTWNVWFWTVDMLCRCKWTKYHHKCRNKYLPVRRTILVLICQYLSIQILVLVPVLILGSMLKMAPGLWLDIQEKGKIQHWTILVRFSQQMFPPRHSIFSSSVVVQFALLHYFCYKFLTCWSVGGKALNCLLCYIRCTFQCLC